MLDSVSDWRTKRHSYLFVLRINPAFHGFASPTSFPSCTTPRFSSKLQHALILTSRRTVAGLCRDGVIGDDVFRKLEHELDLEEARLKI